MGYVVLLLTVGVTIYALVDCWTSGDDEVRGLPRLAWLLIVLLFPPVGAIAYLIFGRPRGHTPQLHRRPRVVAPDDDPEFLRQLEQKRRKDSAQERRDRKEQERLEREARERVEREQRNRLQGDHDGEDHSGRATG